MTVWKTGISEGSEILDLTNSKSKEEDKRAFQTFNFEYGIQTNICHQRFTFHSNLSLSLPVDS